MQNIKLEKTTAEILKTSYLMKIKRIIDQWIRTKTNPQMNAQKDIQLHINFCAKENTSDDRPLLGASCFAGRNNESAKKETPPWKIWVLCIG